MRSGHPGLLNNYHRLFHVSEEPGIACFDPRASPSELPGIMGDVVFAISGRLLHNYLLPRECPRVTYYPSSNTSQADRDTFLSSNIADFVVIVESGWYQRICNTKLYVYEFPVTDFILIDECAGYYVSYKPVIPISVHPVNDCMAALLSKNIELRFIPSLIEIANEVSLSSLNYSLIRMRNAVK